MRAEEKDLESATLEQEELRERDLARDDQLREVAGEDVIDVREAAAEKETERQKMVIGTIRALFEKKNVTISILELPEREARALEALQTAITARHQTGEFVFADDRRDLLEQALAILQPNLTNAAPELLAELGSMERLTDKVASLRGKLSKLEDAQEVLPEWEKTEWLEEDAAGDTDEKPATEPVEVGNQPSTLSVGKAAPDKAEPPSTLAAGGPAAPERPDIRPSALSTGGPAVPEKAAPPSMLVDGGPEAVLEARGSILSEGGPEAQIEEHPSMLGDGPVIPLPPPDPANAVKRVAGIDVRTERTDDKKPPKRRGGKNE